jgi:nitroreductase
VLHDIVRSNRSYRRFDQALGVEEKTLKDLVDLARLSPSAANLQPLRFILSWTADKNAVIFPFLHWAGYLKEWGGPQEGERPAAYIIILGDTAIRNNFGVDHGIAAQSIMLGAVERGLGGCIIASVDKDELRTALNIPAQYEILLVLALGKPVEKVVIDPLGPDKNIKYWRDEQQVHHVPKRDLDDLLL